MSGSLIVKAHRPGRTALIIVAVLTLLIALGAGLFELGQLRGGFNREQTRLELELQDAQLQELQERNQLLRDRIALLEESTRIDREAAAQLRATLEAQDRETMDLRRELAFYRGIVSPADGRAGLRLQGAELTPLSDGSYRLELVLIQALRHDRDQSGRVSVRVAGRGPDGPGSLGLEALTADGGASIPYTFRYFLDLEAELRLPDGFVPEELEVTLDPQASGQPDLVRSFAWGELLGGGAATEVDDVL